MNKFLRILVTVLLLFSFILNILVFEGFQAGLISDLGAFVIQAVTFIAGMVCIALITIAEIDDDDDEDKK